MKNLFSFASALVVAVAMMGGISSCTQVQQPNAVAPMAISDSCRLPIAYINVDSLLSNYEFAKTLNEEILKKAEDSRMSLNTQAAAFEKEVAEFQRKLQTNAFLSEERAVSEKNRLEKKQAQLEQLNQKLQQELAMEQAQMNARMNDSISNFLKKYNEEKHFELILSNMVLLIDNPTYDITADVLDQLNAQYAASKK